MKPTILQSSFRRTVLGAAILALSAGGSLLHAAPAPVGAAAAAPVLGEGLAGLDDHALAAELSGRGLNNLLDHYFQVNHISDADQQAIKTFGALRELRNPASKISVGEKIRRVKEVASGIDSVLSALKDPTEMMGTAGILVEFGVNPDINDIEYWGEDAVTQASLKSTADAVVKLMDAASKSFRKQADDLQNRLKGANDPNATKWDNLDAMAGTAAYNKQMSVYFSAAARAAKDPERKKLAADAITALTEFDNDQTGVQPRIRNMIGKLLMVSGDLDKAKKTLGTVAAKEGLTPAPNAYEQNEARYFMVVCDLMAKDIAAAKTDEAALTAWQGNGLAAEQATLKLSPAQIAADNKANAAAEMLLQWRMDSLEEDLAKSKADKEKAKAAGEAVVAKLREAHPELNARIDQQLVKRLPTDAKIDDKITSSVLVALERKGLSESYKTADDKPDPAIVKKGIEAAETLVKRKGTPGVTAGTLEEAQLAIAQLQLHLGNKVEAANGFLDYAAANYPTNPVKATQAFDAAGALIMNDLRKMQPNAPVGFADVYARFLPMAINPPYSHLDLAYPYAEQLRGLKQFKEALKFYRLIPKTSPQYSLAKYKEMLTLESMLDTKQEPADHKQTVADALLVGEEVKKLNESPKDDYDRNHALEAIGMLADLYRIELKDPARTLQVLDGYETLVAGISDGTTPAEKKAKEEQKAYLVRGVQVSRINAYMALGKSADAVQAVKKLLDSAKGDDGINFVKVLLDKLNKDFVNADLVHNTAVMKESARGSALLTGYLVTYSDPKTQKNPKIADYYYAYVAYDATAQRIAGSLVEDPAESKKLLQAAADRFRFLQSPEMHALYAKQPDISTLIKSGKVDATDPDWQVQTGLALADFDLGNYKEARELLNPIIALKKLGSDTVTVSDPVNGQFVTKPNDLYWEALYKLIKSDCEVGKTDPEVRTAGVKMLKNILILGGVPDRWQDEFESARKDYIPDFNPDKPAAAKPAVPAATKPAAPTASAAAAK